MDIEELLRQADHFLTVQEEALDCQKLLDLLKELRLACKRLQEEAIIDFLTRLYNRRFFEDQLELAIERAKRDKVPFSLIILDLDHFKKINDQFGHLIGDQVLQEVANLIKKNVRKVDIPARYGGEEFAVIMPGTGLEGALSAAKRLKRSIENFRFGTKERPIRITASIGVGTYRPFESLGAEEFLAQVDQLLYAAKQGGRNCIVHEDIRLRSSPEGLSSEEKKALLKGVWKHDD